MAAVALLKDLQEVVAGRGVERLQPPIVEDQKIDPAQPLNRRGWRPSPRASARAPHSRG